jgi:ribonuclease HI
MATRLNWDRAKRRKPSEDFGLAASLAAAERQWGPWKTKSHRPRSHPARGLSSVLPIEDARARLVGAKTATAHCDGACSPNPGPGGWGLTIAVPGLAVVELAGGDVNTTNNRMEVVAALMALRVLPHSCEAMIVSDSQYVVRGATEWLRGWRAKRFLRSGQPMPNADLWRELDRLIEGRPVRWSWVRGHSGHHLNERADRLAAAGIVLAIQEAKNGLAA